MNSLPFISHHLFVAAVGNEDRAHERPTRHLRPSGGAVTPLPAGLIEVPDSRRPISDRTTLALRTCLAQARG